MHSEYTHVLYKLLVIFQISRLTWYTRFDPVKESEEVVAPDPYTIEGATQYTKDEENDAHELKEGTISTSHAFVALRCDFN